MTIACQIAKPNYIWPPLIAGWSSPVARQAHNLKVVGSNPAPATNFLNPGEIRGFLVKTYRVYVIRNEAGRIYIGISEDIQKRLIDHNTGLSEWTKAKGPWKLIWSSDEMNLSEALRFEKLLKRQKGGLGLYRLTGIKRQAHNPA
jgi:putative endonuclease